MKKLISKETIAEVQKAYNELAEKNLAQCKEYKFNNVEYFAIGFCYCSKTWNRLYA